MKKKILIVEDEQQPFLKLKKWLEDRNYDVLPSNFGEMASAIDKAQGGDIKDFVIRQIKDNYWDLKLVLCDIKLGEDLRGGNKVVKEIRKYKELNANYVFNLPIIAITSYADRQEAMLCDGADLPIVKSRFDEEPDVINALIETFIDRFEKRLEQLHIIKDSKKIFIVHGHAGAEEMVARFLERLKLVPIILHEQPNNGRTIIEKIERNTNVGFAIVLYTHCDDGKATEESEYKPRARQNVVFEHGYLTAKLGRENVCVCLEDGVEKPGDINGLVYISLDSSGAWKNELADNLKTRGFDINKNLI